MKYNLQGGAFSDFRQQISWCFLVTDFFASWKQGYIKLFLGILIQIKNSSNFRKKTKSRYESILEKLPL